MKKLFLLLGLAAAGYGAMKLIRGSQDDEFASDMYAPPSSYDPARTPSPPL